MKSFDIIFIQETWLLSELLLNGFTSYTLAATPAVARGRPNGGLACLISTSVVCAVLLLPSLGSIAMALLLTFNDREILVVNVYIPPYSSPFYYEHCWSDLEMYIYDLETKFHGAQTILLGDFNARLGNGHFRSAYAEHIGDFYNQSRNTKDPLLNKTGKRFWQLIDKLNLVILNGNFQGDELGEFTYFSKNGASLIDYLAITPLLLDKISYFTVGTQPESDHQPLIFYMHTPKASLNNGEDSFFPIDQVLVTADIRLKWSPILRQEIQRILYSAPMLKWKGGKGKLRQLQTSTLPLQDMVNQQTL